MEVAVHDLELAYGDFVAIKSLDLIIPDGESVVLLGQSGCGKTSTMRCIAGLEMPTGGTISIGDKTVFDGNSGRVVPVYKRNVGMVFQSYAVWPHKTVLENVAFPLKMKGVAKSKRRAEALAVLELVGLAHLADRGASMLSGGQMQRVALARSMAMAPSVLLLDEPLSNLDARLRDDLRVELRRIQTERGLTSLYVTHDQQEALALADRIAIMQEGRISQLGTPEQIYGSPVSASIASFLGVTNVFSVASDSTSRSLHLTGSEVVLRSTSDVPAVASSACIRPEDILVTLDQPRDADSAAGHSGTNLLDGVVEIAVFQGATIRCKVKLDGGVQLDAVCAPPADGVLAPGARVKVTIAADAVKVLPDEAPVVDSRVAVAA
ncbi:ABC transporter ATP-binding protein [Rhodococcus sp. 06-412-2C]|uniref:ABC transporter ATP-binding protein n=1 Tax=unclassified Rhodococcus (in: high G+C Gram-positive bacteria) TaxID=192944 RepID=UPI000B9A98AD|nr:MULTISPECIES: ABC transporter ATP-binding protein [unclassified Rhodococcus (in: high G+C Gram-positive bacteria)]OZC84022.1 ABC transporter ATP-binding protein [Rhodococcus sp. 06-412-2C]OZC94209.1 ABC transporter ATP-binding protein [Rhodococcus sp. 06-412-2B]